MEKENVSFDFRLKRIDETKNYILEEIKYNDLMSGKHRKVCRALSYLEHFFFLSSAVFQFLHFLH